MNKELIKKYFREFEHWLKGGKVLACPIRDKLNGYSIDWQPIDENALWDNKDIAYIINDKYVEYSKAGAEGKQLQVSYDDGKTWYDKLYRKISWSKSKLLRIKPERHKYKVGDWVIHNGKYKRVTKAVDGYIDSLDNEVAVIMKEESLELWEPQEEKYFWYKNDLVKFHETQTNYGTLLMSARGCSYYPAEENFEEYCEPFIGQLPTKS
jgi:hypothetical protein